MSATISESKKRTVKAESKTLLVLGPDSAGIILSPDEFDSADFEDGWRYELIYGVLLATPVPLESEADPNEELGSLLRIYNKTHPHGKSLDRSLAERIIKLGPNRRRPDRVIWAGLGRRPRKDETPTIIVEFVSKRKRDRERDYRTKRVEYLQAGVKEYWVIDRFLRTMTVFVSDKKPHIVSEKGTYKTELLPGFELPLMQLLDAAAYWTTPDSEEKA
jgi:Uma2 family endonuclease